MLRFALPLVWPALIALAGCVGTKHPVIAVTGATLDQTTDQAATVRVALRLQNPNDEPLELQEFEYRFAVPGQPVYRGKRSAQMTLARQSTRVVEIPAVIAFSSADANHGAALADAAFQVQGTLRYLAPRAIEQTLFDTGVRRPRASFAATGHIAAPAAGSTPVGNDR